MVRECNKTTVKMRDGYTDGEFNYFSERRGYWHCIDPQTGLSIATGSSKEKAQTAAKSVADKFESEKSTERYERAKKLFAELRLFGGEVAQ